MQILLKYLVTHFYNCDVNGSHTKWWCDHVWGMSWLIEDALFILDEEEDKTWNLELMFWRALTTTFCFIQTSTSLISAGTWILSTTCCKTSVDQESEDHVQEKLTVSFTNVFRRKTWGRLLKDSWSLFPKSFICITQICCRGIYLKSCLLWLALSEEKIPPEAVVTVC